jgi:hypothetical protein
MANFSIEKKTNRKKQIQKNKKKQKTKKSLPSVLDLALGKVFFAERQIMCARQRQR